MNESLIGRLENILESGIEYLPTSELIKQNLIETESCMPTKKKSDLLKILKEKKIGDCQRCNLSENRENLVFGSGSPEAKIIFVGEAPGAEEDKQGLPFVGRSGNLLTKMIGAMGYSRDEIYICNVIKCRPPSNRDPLPDEVDACEPFLKKQLEIIKPKVIIGLGRYACQTVLKTNTPMGEMRGVWHEYENIKFMPTFHPAYLLRSPSKKREAWQDLQKVMAYLK